MGKYLNRHIVEFFGIPSSGKSTVANKLINLAESKRLSCKNEFDDMYTTKALKQRGLRIIRALGFAFSNRSEASNIHKLHKRCFPSLSMQLSWDYYILNLLYCYIHPRGENIEIYSQGIIQYLISLKSRRPELECNGILENLSKYFASVTIVYLKCPVELALERMMSREGYSYIDKTVSQSAKMEKMNAVFNICEDIHCIFKDRIIVIDAKNDADSNAAIILDCLEKR